MIYAIDSSALTLLVNPQAKPPNDPETALPVAQSTERIEFFLSSLGPNDTIIIPTPALAEALVYAGDGAPAILNALKGRARVKVRPFGERAAVETAAMTREAIEAGDKRSGSDAPWQKVKVDRQIVAVARVEGAQRVYSDDKALVRFAKLVGMPTVSTWELERPPKSDPDLFTVLNNSESGEV